MSSCPNHAPNIAKGRPARTHHIYITVKEPDPGPPNRLYYQTIRNHTEVLVMRRWLAVLVALLSFTVAGCSLGAGLLSTDGPLQLEGLAITQNSIGVPQARFTVRNISTQPVKAFRVEVDVWNAYGARLKRYGYGEKTFGGIYQDAIEPGRSETVTWTLHGFDTAYTIEGTITSAVFDNDKTWYKGMGDKRYTATASK